MWLKTLQVQTSGLSGGTVFDHLAFAKRSVLPICKSPTTMQH